MHSDVGVATGADPARLAAAVASPARFVWSVRDPVGNRSRTVPDPNGNTAASTPPRGTAAGTGSHTATFDNGDLPTSTTRPKEQGARYPATRMSYDVFGNLTASDTSSPSTPAGPSSTVGVNDHPVNRPVRRRPASAPAAAAPSLAGRRTTAATAAGPLARCGAAPAPATTRSTRLVTSTHQAGKATSYRYDSRGRRVSLTTPRSSTLTLYTRAVYDADGNTTDVCSPREYDPSEPGASLTCGRSALYGTHADFDSGGWQTASYRYRTAGTPLQTTVGYDGVGNPSAHRREGRGHHPRLRHPRPAGHRDPAPRHQQHPGHRLHHHLRLRQGREPDQRALPGHPPDADPLRPDQLRPGQPAGRHRVGAASGDITGSAPPARTAAATSAAAPSTTPTAMSWGCSARGRSAPAPAATPGS